MRDGLNLKKISTAAVLINWIQISVVLTIFIYSILYGIPNINKKGTSGFVVFLIIIVLALITNSYLMQRYIGMTKQNSRFLNMLWESNHQLEELNMTLRAQRHDFMNHLQVVHSLIEMDEYSDAKDYIEKIYEDIQKVNRVLKTSKPAINALLQAKIIQAEGLGIQCRLSITTALENLSIPSWELCRVLGNIIDNAMYALNENNEAKTLSIKLYEDLKNYSFTIGNSGPGIPEAMVHRIFEAGYTSKGDRGDGMGLAISKELLESYGGSIEVASGEQWTEFKGSIPKKA